jgi:beta-N-acetylhexosaminidase
MNYDLDAISTYGSKFIVEPSSTKLSEQEKQLLEELQPAGIMFRKRNFLDQVEYSEWLSAYTDLVSEIRETIKREALILCIDHEGGRVIRPPLPVTRFPYPAKWSDRSAEVAEAMAVELRSLAINVTFSPVADIHSNPDNPVINQRAFGRNPDDVVNSVLIYAETLTEQGLAPCAKHFPGHGDTSKDSHFELPILDFTLEELEARELIPFRALIAQGVPLVMTAHLMFPSIDDENPATVSEDILDGILRKRLGFTGVTVADAMGMKAIINLLEHYETTVKAVNAGLDLYCVAGDAVDLRSAEKWANFMRTGVQRGDIAEEKIIESFRRIENFTGALPSYEVQELDSDIFEKHHVLAEELDGREDWGHFDLKLPGFE